MTLEERIHCLSNLKTIVKELDKEEKADLYLNALNNNPWFTKSSIDLAFEGILKFLDINVLTNWINNYELPDHEYRIGIVMAGNIPLVGFHDLLSVLVSGHIAVVKLSSQDNILIKKLVEYLVEINTDFNNRIEFVDTLPKVDAVIAAGSDNSARYFKKYFKGIPHIIRKNRTSIAVLDGNETATELEQLGKDIFNYFGLGCRNVSKVLVPQGYDMQTLLDRLRDYHKVGHHARYFNNYEYNKAIYLVNSTEHLDTGFALFLKTQDLTSPLSVIYYEEYKESDQLHSLLEQYSDKLQCIVSRVRLKRPTVLFGDAQLPEIDDYADNIDTMKFLCEL